MCHWIDRETRQSSGSSEMSDSIHTCLHTDLHTHILFARWFPCGVGVITQTSSKGHWHIILGTIAALLQEIINIYPAINPPTLTAHQSNRVCNALALLQCVASHPETRSVFLQVRFGEKKVESRSNGCQGGQFYWSKLVLSGFLFLPLYAYKIKKAIHTPPSRRRVGRGRLTKNRLH